MEWGLGTGDWVLGTGYWGLAGLSILWLILNDIYKPAPRDWGLGMFRCVTTEIHFSCFPKF
jgi:hypothetical protein